MLTGFKKIYCFFNCPTFRDWSKHLYFLPLEQFLIFFLTESNSLRQLLQSPFSTNWGSESAMDTTFLKFVVISLIFLLASDNFLSDHNALKREHSNIFDDWFINSFAVSWKFYQFPLLHSSCELHIWFLLFVYPFLKKYFFCSKIWYAILFEFFQSYFM